MCACVRLSGGRGILVPQGDCGAVWIVRPGRQGAIVAFPDVPSDQFSICCNRLTPANARSHGLN